MIPYMWFIRFKGRVHYKSHISSNSSYYAYSSLPSPTWKFIDTICVFLSKSSMRCTPNLRKQDINVILVNDSEMGVTP